MFNPDNPQTGLLSQGGGRTSVRSETLACPQGISHYIQRPVPLNQGLGPGLIVDRLMTGLHLWGTRLC